MRANPVPESLQVLSHPATNIDGRAGNVTGPVAGQEGDKAGDLVRLTEPAERDLRLGQLPEDLRGRGVRRALAVDVVPLRGFHEADVDAVDEDVLGPELGGQCLG